MRAGSMAGVGASAGAWPIAALTCRSISVRSRLLLAAVAGGGIGRAVLVGGAGGVRLPHQMAGALANRMRLAHLLALLLLAGEQLLVAVGALEFQRVECQALIPNRKSTDFFGLVCARGVGGTAARKERRYRPTDRQTKVRTSVGWYDVVK